MAYEPAFAPVVTAGIAGFPERVASLREARALIEAQRMPSIRSQYAWLDAHNRATLALATGNPLHVEAARRALAVAVADEARALHHPAPAALAA